MFDTIGKKIAAGFGVVLVLLFFLAALNFWGVGRIVEDATLVIEGNKLNAELFQREVDHLKWVESVSEYLEDDHATELHVGTDPRQCGFGKWYYGEGRTHAEKLIPEIKPLLAQIEEPHKKLHESAVAMKGQEKGQAKAIFMGQTLPAVHSVEELLEQIRKVREQNVLTDDAMLETASGVKVSGGIVALIAIAAGALLALLITKGIVTSLRRISGEMGEASSQVAAAAGEVSSSSQSLAEGASKQAAAVEETSASMEEVSAMTKQDAENAMQADNLMRDAANVISTADESMQKLTTSMEEIASASSQTQKIVKTIDEIAFQTNLLALNAAVEAARAGEAGAGFAVVADEVRNLAMRAAEAAKNTSNLIEGTVQKVNTGSNLVKETSESFNAASQATARIGTLIAEIASSSSEQAKAIGQVGTAISEIDSVTQGTAAAAEQAAAASEELSAQSEMMRSSVAQMLKMVGGTESQENRSSGTRRPPTMLSRQMRRPALPPVRQTSQGKLASEVIPFGDEA